MRFSFSKHLLFLLFISACSSPKKTIHSTDDKTIGNLQQHIAFLADDKLEGRRTGTKGEKLAMEYIISQFENIGLQPKGVQKYTQPFEVNDGKVMDDKTMLQLNGVLLQKGNDYFMFPFSKDTAWSGDIKFGDAHNDSIWLVDIKTVFAENNNNPHFDLSDYIYKNSKKAFERGADAVILYNSSATDDKLVFNPKDKAELLNGAVVYLKNAVAGKYFSNDTTLVHIDLAVHFTEKKRTGYNVVGYIDNHATNTIILGAHFDHLGYGEDGNSRSTGHEPMIHNGADDNASGTAALIELARKLKHSKLTNNNYLFIAFSGEELGLYGSKYFTDHPTVDLNKVNYMINMDMVGRLNDSTKVITIGGYGTSPAWGEVYPEAKDRWAGSPLVFKFDSSGTGPSDHTSFYRKDIPVLFYFTGLHSDYHKPTDDADKINYQGEDIILNHIMKVIADLNNHSKLTFTKTKETQTTTAARFSVTMGIMPDYTFAGTGVKSDGVTEGKPAQKAGIQAGDIILQIGEYKITSMESYMQTLGHFKKGDSVKVIFNRAGKLFDTTVVF